MRASTFRLIERSTLLVTGFTLGGVGALSVLLNSLTLGLTCAIAAVVWLPFIVPYLIDLRATNDLSLEPMVEASRKRSDMSALLKAASGEASGAEEAVRPDGDRERAGDRPGGPGER